MTALDARSDPGPVPTSLARVVYSFTSLNCYYSICPYQFFRRYVAKDVPWVESTAMAKGNAIHSAFELRIGGGKPLPEGMRQWEGFCTPFDNSGALVERKYAVDATGYPVDYWNNKVLIRGKIDLNVVRSETAYIADWKSGKVREDPFELEVGAMLLHSANPQLKKIVASYVWLAENRVGVQHDVSATAKTWDKCQRIIAQVKADMAADHFEKRQGPLCKWCNVFDCEYNKNENS